jgi:hypothetical protein
MEDPERRGARWLKREYSSGDEESWRRWICWEDEWDGIDGLERECWKIMF